MLDAKIRESTGGRNSLDDVLRSAYARFSGTCGFEDEQLRLLIGEVAESDLRSWLHRAVDTTEELDYREALAYYGLHFKAPEPPTRSWLGCEVKKEHGRLTIPAAYGNFAAQDEILAIGGYRVQPEQWAQRMEQFQPGETVGVLVARREKLVTVECVLSAERTQSWRLAVDGIPNEAFTSWTAPHQRR